MKQKDRQQLDFRKAKHAYRMLHNCFDASNTTKKAQFSTTIWWTRKETTLSNGMVMLSFMKFVIIFTVSTRQWMDIYAKNWVHWRSSTSTEEWLCWGRNHQQDLSQTQQKSPDNRQCVWTQNVSSITHVVVPTWLERCVQNILALVACSVHNLKKSTIYPKNCRSLVSSVSSTKMLFVDPCLGMTNGEPNTSSDFSKNWFQKNDTFCKECNMIDVTLLDQKLLTVTIMAGETRNDVSALFWTDKKLIIDEKTCPVLVRTSCARCYGDGCKREDSGTVFGNYSFCTNHPQQWLVQRDQSGRPRSFHLHFDETHQKLALWKQIGNLNDRQDF